MFPRRLIVLLGLLVGIVAIIVLLAVAFIYSGLYNVSAAYKDSAPLEWVLGTTMDKSVERHARGVKVPPLDNPTWIQLGSQHYKEDCEMCHGAPGVPIGEVGQGLNPSPPELTEAASDWKPNELYWITKNGVRMTGMPGWGINHTDTELWHMVAFMRKLSSMSPTEYKTLSSSQPGSNP